MDIRVVQGNNNQVSIFTASGMQLVSGTQASTLRFDRARHDLGAGAMERQSGAKQPRHHHADRADGSTIDLVATNAIRSGEIAAYLEMRDKVLVQAQEPARPDRRRDVEALSDTTTDGTR